MFNLDKFLDKFRNIIPPNNEVKINIIEIIENELSININRKDISIRNKIIYIKTKSIIKNEIFINKIKILEILKNKIGNILINDIR